LALISKRFKPLPGKTRTDQAAWVIAGENDIMHGDLARRIEVTPASDEFDRLAANMNAMLQRLQEVMQTYGRSPPTFRTTCARLWHRSCWRSSSPIYSTTFFCTPRVRPRPRSAPHNPARK
jgi:hypothetical protein